MENFLQKITDTFLKFINLEIFQLGETAITGSKLVAVILMLVAAWWAGRLVEHTLMKLSTRHSATKLNPTGAYALSRILRYAIWIGISLLGLNYLGINISSLALFGGAIGVGVGFGLQTIFSNLVSGIIILMEKTLKVGDFVDLESGTVGTVKEISLRYTRVITNDNVDIIVPNSEFVNGRVTNWTYDELLRRIHVPFGVAYGTDKALVKEAAIEAAKCVSGTVTSENRMPDVWLVKFGDNSLDFELVIWVERALLMSPGRTQAKYLWAIETELAQRGIEIPFPQRDLHVRSGTLSVKVEKET
jgi:small-conductance mechanosensitive channel